ncbi:hypothetical protein ANANG_G00319180 [Anguilla anguilla]|uniref:Uncharacterized protein n=1 Tax=Anguilla anguilla TaxID=7936 RepID=A0A9D3LNX6_ANGAN|nr:hypothetical protein ANANG_G00319180 [Anguilla anguilla]
MTMRHAPNELVHAQPEQASTDRLPVRSVIFSHPHQTHSTGTKTHPSHNVGKAFKRKNLTVIIFQLKDNQPQLQIRQRKLDKERD